MAKQKQARFNPIQQERIAKFWHEARRVLVEKQYGGQNGHVHERTKRFQNIADNVNAKTVLDAAVGTGMPTFIDINRVPLAQKFYCSDGDAAMISLLRKTYFAGESLIFKKIEERTFVAKWNELGRVFPDGTFGLVTVLGNSLQYCTGWQGESSPVEHREVALIAALTAIRKTLAENGVLLFDIPRYTAGTMDLGTAVIDGKPSALSIDVKYKEGKRYWTIRMGSTRLTLEGLALDMDDMKPLLEEARFRKIERVDDKLQLDPMFYESYLAYK
jgi:SAM-dependent methyltransferase